ncbi:MAG: hypothetical protein ACK50M_01890 [Cyclobacteriaceae bacterium]
MVQPLDAIYQRTLPIAIGTESKSSREARDNLSLPECVTQAGKNTPAERDETNLNLPYPCLPVKPPQKNASLLDRIYREGLR